MIEKTLCLSATSIVLPWESGNTWRASHLNILLLTRGILKIILDGRKVVSIVGKKEAQKDWEGK